MTTAFSEKFYEEVKKRLVEEQERLLRQIEQVKTGAGHVGHPFEGVFPELGDKEDENAAEVATFSDNLTLGRELEALLRDIRGALDRIEKGTYGICKYCKKPIDERRLQARPMSSACVECKKLLTQEA